MISRPCSACHIEHVVMLTGMLPCVTSSRKIDSPVKKFGSEFLPHNPIWKGTSLNNSITTGHYWSCVLCGGAAYRGLCLNRGVCRQQGGRGGRRRSALGRRSKHCIAGMCGHLAA